MEVSGQLYALAALFLGKGLPGNRKKSPASA
jgi:hypothetical protein